MLVRHITRYLDSHGTTLLDVDGGGKWSAYGSGNTADGLRELERAVADAVAKFPEAPPAPAATAVTLVSPGGAQ
jgi:hypothetical protein